MKKTRQLKQTLFPRNVRYFNTSLIKSKIDMLENYAKKNQLHKLRMDDLFEVFKLSKTEEDYKLSLHLLNVYYNFGRNLNTQQDVNLFFIFILRSGQLNEAKDVRQIKLESSFYSITIKSMLMLKENSVEESMIIYDDSFNMSIYLTNEVHNLLLGYIFIAIHHKMFFNMSSMNSDLGDSNKVDFYQGNIEKIIVRLINEMIKNRTYVKLSSKSLSLFAWTKIYFDLNKIISKSNNRVVDVEECSTWLEILKLACLYNQIPECHCSPFSVEFKHVLRDMQDDPDAVKALEYINMYFWEE
ncbi:conserved Plasmodium protein, unknown function [Plasmodium ovale wallikeri]|uniref:Uncharacterized protein n=1 Tax=Plasmodium ovale wallikeri TaxID=864142 RepID=A0A1A8YPD2_PLAOA|nr:conserved Plasmodium protein, unknown function [Plasmodium ovale wallikeri]SBT33466.1 conserved Plasmodium protein, unknown function [Plasmodium ovale wallikeri]